MLGLGFSGYYLASFLDFAGLAYVSASFERLILYLNPTIVLLLSWAMFGRRVTLRQAGALAVSYAGVLLVFGHELQVAGANVWLGGALVFGSAVSYALYLVYSGERVKRLGAMRLTGLATSVACGFCIAQFLLTRPVSAGWRILRPAVWWLSVLNALACTFAPVLMVMMAIERMGAGAHRADRHGRPHVHDTDGRADPRRAADRLGRRGHGAGAGRRVAARAPASESRTEIDMDLGLTGKWALVCAASKGLGAGCAEALAAEGVNVVITARGEEALQSQAAELRALNPAVQVVAVAGDITTEAGRAAALAAAPQVDILINNAGGPPPGDFRDWEREQWLAALDANMLTPIALIKATVDQMAGAASAASSTSPRVR